MVDSSTRHDIIDALRSWDRAVAKTRIAKSEELRTQFVERFPTTAWAELSLADYALGQGSQDVVSYWMEFKDGLIPSMKGGSAYKHLIYQTTSGPWYFPKEYDSVDQAWEAIRAGFVQLLDLSAQGKFDDADDVKTLYGASALRAKLLCMYFPGDLIGISSKDDIDHYLRALGETPAASVVRANMQLLNNLRAIRELDELSNQELGIFLYHWHNPRPSQRVVKIAPGEQGKFWQDCVDNDFICVGWDDVGDLTQFDTKDQFRDTFREHYPYNGVEHQVSRKANELWTLRELQPGDTVIANRGTEYMLGVGTVNETGYAWHPDRPEYRHTVGVDWDTQVGGPIEQVKAWATTTVSKVSAELQRKLLGREKGRKLVEADTKLLELEAALERRGQAILYGPPGTGKTYIARRAAAWLLDGGSANPQANEILGDTDALTSREHALTQPVSPGKAARLTRITFHPSYAYEDFVEGFRPQQSATGTMQLCLADGIFKRVCETAYNDPTNNYIVLIDEINRGNIPKILGELITLIEKDKRGLTVQLPQSGDSFSVPPNVRIIGTMNTADRSIHLLDTALRRRFQFVELLPDSELLEGRSVGPLALDAFLGGLNDEIRARFGRDKQIGHSMFFQNGEIIETPEDFAAIVRYELIPLLQEYLYEDYQAIGDLLGSVIDAQAQQIGDLANDPEGLCVELANKYGSASA
ncbi:AAA family ATPase [Mycolicibacterium phocaicum]|uniref:AAA family ATPase n=1 Tax=Mycolicibacterium phocaicum TaxID=319706 RepID=UPI001CFC357A|nr:AAA family ATPase [Mycolicibacterium phocaicum]UCZ61896.1 AAA family ATPase [Mycolicibacterium phocaicum]